MLLSGKEIQEEIAKGELVIEPFTADSIQPACIDLKLYSKIQIQSSVPIPGISLDPETLDVEDLLSRYSEEEDLSEIQSYDFRPNQFIIGRTEELVGLPHHLAGRVEGRSRLARLGVGVHITAPKIDPGFRNRITLEMYNSGPWTIKLTAGMTICTLLIERLSQPVEHGYSGIFQGSQSIENE